MAAYTASKAGVEAFGDALRAELAHTGTKVGVAYFSFIDTDMVRNAFATPAIQAARRGMPGFLSNPIPVEAAGAAIVRGIEKRSNHVYAPRWVPALFAGRGLVHVFGNLPARDPRFVNAIKVAESGMDRAADETARAEVLR
jgi:short-subunit dehydrogenase